MDLNATCEWALRYNVNNNNNNKYLFFHIVCTILTFQCYWKKREYLLKKKDTTRTLINRYFVFQNHLVDGRSMYYAWITAVRFLPPTKEVWGKVMFLQLSVILFTAGFVCVCDWGRGMTRGVYIPTLQSTSGRYASYWNAFLCLQLIVQ